MKPGTPPLDSRRLALERTWLAQERTLMAWVRTAMSFITFGFSVYKFFEYEAERGRRPRPLLTPREFGIVMIAIGLSGLVLATVQHRVQVKPLAEAYGARRFSVAELVAVLVLGIGVVALTATLLRD